MGVKRVTRVALVGVVPLLLVACFGEGHREHGGGPGSGGTTGTGWTTIAGGHAGSAGSAGGSAGARDAGTPDDGGHDAGGACHSNLECPSGATCIAPGEVLCGGTCVPVTNRCTTDSDCAPDAAVPIICNYVPCACDSGKRCMPGCVSDADCPAGATCGTTYHRCAVIGCGPGKPPCPANFTCDDSQSPACSPTLCTTDSQCSGACVGGACSSAPGQCQFPPA